MLEDGEQTGLEYAGVIEAPMLERKAGSFVSEIGHSMTSQGKTCVPFLISRPTVPGYLV
jgi:hypothetical protein